jgi:hypothetical protein
MVMKTRFYLMIASVAILSLISCQKDSSTTEQASINVADDETVSDAVFDDVFSTADNVSVILDQMVKGGDSKSMIVLADSCPSIIISNPETATWPKTVTVDFGAGCSGLYDNTRSGKIIITITGPRLETGAKKTITFENYFFNGIKVEGTKVIENTGYNENQNLVCSVKLTDGKLILPDGRFIERSTDHQREWIAGMLTKNIWDDECLVTGVASGKTLEGVAYSNTITTALHWKRVCFFIVSGVVKIEREGKETVEIDYGTGDCDAKAVVTRGGESREILLRHKIRTMVR